MSPFLSKCYWVSENFLAGGTFSSWSEGEVIANLEDLQRAGVKAIVSLISWDELLPDVSKQQWLQQEIEAHFTHYLFPLCEGAAPDHANAQQILDALDAELSDNRRVYVHCVGGRGRTGTIAGCWLARHGCGSGEEVLEAITALRHSAALDSQSPETKVQRDLVRQWQWNE